MTLWLVVKMAFDLGPQASGLARGFCWVRGVLVTAFLVPWTAFIAVTVMILAVIFGNHRKFWSPDLAIVTWARVLLKLYNIQVEVRGLDNIPKGGCLFLFNHSSNFDIMSIVSALGFKKRARFGAKIELFKIPLFGRAMLKAGVLPIARAQRDKVFELYRESVQRVHNGESFILAAEGTRQPTPGVGEQFKAGPVVFAILGQFPIVPIVLRGAAEVQPKGHLVANKDRLQSRIRVTILPPVATAGFTLDDRPRLVEDLRLKMTKTYAED